MTRFQRFLDAGLAVGVGGCGAVWIWGLEQQAWWIRCLFIAAIWVTISWQVSDPDPTPWWKNNLNARRTSRQ